MKNKNDNLENNISRLIKRTEENTLPTEKFTENLINKATNELSKPQTIKTAAFRKKWIIRWVASAAAVIIIVAGVFVWFNLPAERIDDNGFSVIGETPAEMVTLASLNMAYRRGGMEAVEKQYQNAFKNTGPRPVKLTIEDLFAELNGG